MDRVIGLVVVLMIIVAALAVIGDNQNNKQQLKQTKVLVDSAVKEIQIKGVTAFPEFNSFPWYYQDRYVFVWRIGGVRVVYPPDPGAVGDNMADLKDSNGKPIGKLFIQTAENGGGTVVYQWPKPGSTVPTKKITYIQKVQHNNVTYLVGSGYYPET